MDEIKDFFDTVRSGLINDDPCDRRSEDGIFYEALEITLAEFGISETEFFARVEIRNDKET